MSDSVDVNVPDYQLAARELKDKFSALNPKLTATITGGAVLVSDADKWDHYAYNVCFLNTRTGCYANFAWRQGSGVKDEPKASTVLGAVCQDYADSDCSFEDWADNYGYDKDSRKAEKMFNACRETGVNLKHLGLTTEQIQEFAAINARL